MSFLTSIWSFVLILLGFGFLIFVHELGHFLAAKWAGIRTQAFAVGMGPVVCSWRKGVGLAFGKTDAKVVAKAGKPADELDDEALTRHGLGETEYTLRWLPIGGFVKMLGQEDANPTAVSDDPRSYTRCPIGRRMIVVSAGVIMNVLLALVLFVVAFMVGVQFEAPVVGGVRAAAPAAVTMPTNASAVGISEVGLQSGDRIRRIDGDRVLTFADVEIASAMARPGAALDLVVERPGVSEPLEFKMTPEPSPSGLLAIGIEPARSSRLFADAPAAAQIDEYLARTPLGPAGVTAGMQLTSVDGAALTTYDAFEQIVSRSGGRPVMTSWVDETAEPAATVTATLVPEPAYQTLWDAERRADRGVLGFVPLIRFVDVTKDSLNRERVLPGDVVLRIDGVDGPRDSQFRALVRENASKTLALTLLRDGVEMETTVEVSRAGMIGVQLEPADDLVIAEVLASRMLDPLAAEPSLVATPAAALDLLPRTRILAVDGRVVETWPAFREALRLATAAAHAGGEKATVPLTVAHPTPDMPRETLALTLTPDDVAALHELTWTSGLPREFFEPIFTTLSAGGNPLTAIAMGFRQTHKMITMTYLTIDRLFRGSVGVEQLRGPVGIIDLGAKVLPRGFMYFLLFLGMISVNLAVLNFLPLPIVDGGLFLFLIYEKLKGRPPSIAFQNAATFVGLFLIGTVFVVTFYNDIMRLL